jgi:hypothetical protein
LIELGLIYNGTTSLSEVPEAFRERRLVGIRNLMVSLTNISSIYILIDFYLPFGKLRGGSHSGG